jgi:hypothetical protein
VYLLFWQKSTNTDTRRAACSVEDEFSVCLLYLYKSTIIDTKSAACSVEDEFTVYLFYKYKSTLTTQFTCFTGTKVQILTREALRAVWRTSSDARLQAILLTCVCMTWATILPGSFYLLYQYKKTQSTCFTSTKAQILTSEELRGGGSGAGVGWVLEFDGPNHFFVCKAAKGATIIKDTLNSPLARLLHAPCTPLTRILHASLFCVQGCQGRDHHQAPTP